MVEMHNGGCSGFRLELIIDRKRSVNIVDPSSPVGLLSGLSRIERLSQVQLHCSCYTLMGLSVISNLLEL